jgi:hypothetical protein
MRVPNRVPNRVPTKPNQTNRQERQIPETLMK